MPFTRGPWRNHDFHHAKRPKNQPNPRCAHAEPSSLWTSPRVELAAQLSPRCWDDHPIEDWKHSIGWGLKRYGDGILKKTFHAQKKEPSIHLSQSFQLRLALSICMYIYIYIQYTYIYIYCIYKNDFGFTTWARKTTPQAVDLFGLLVVTLDSSESSDSGDGQSSEA